MRISIPNNVCNAFALLAWCVTSAAAPITQSTLTATLTTGSLAGTTFQVSFSYDAGQVQATGESFVNLLSFDFVLLGVPFHKSDLSQGGQVIFEDGAYSNATASFQGKPLDSPVGNITFGFGGPGVIGYDDVTGEFGLGTFTSAAVPEPSASVPLGAALLIALVCFGKQKAGNGRPRIFRPLR